MAKQDRLHSRLDAITYNSNTAATTTANQLVTGAYTLIVTNRDNGCVASRVFDLPFDDAQVLSYLV